MLEWVLIIGLAWVYLGFEGADTILSPKVRLTSSWIISTSFGTLDGGQEVVVEQATQELTTSIPAADGKQEKVVTEQIVYRPARVKDGVSTAIPSPDGRKLFRGATTDATFPTMVAERDWEQNKPTGGAGPIGPQEPEPQPNLPNPEPEGPAGEGPPVTPPPQGGLGGFDPSPYNNNQGFNLGGGMI